MDNNKNTDNNINLKKEQKLSIHAILIILFIVVGLGISYAFFAIQKQNSTSITASANCYTVNYTKGQDINGELTLGEDYTSGYSTDIIMYADPKCELLSATLYITTNQDSTMDFSDEALRYTVVVNEEVVSEGHINGTTNQPIYENFVLNTVETTYKVYIWLDSEKEDTTNMESETFGGFIHADVVLTSKLSESLVTVTNLGLASNIKKDIPNFSKTSCLSGCDETTVGLYEAEDDLGTSYYFRGDVTNNYVKFGKNSSGQDMYWRIIRINGDGSVRMIYMGTDVNATELTAVESIPFASRNGVANDNTFVGYMYGDAGQTTYAETHSNKYDSPIKIFLEGTEENNYEDGWYYQNIVATGYHNYIADAIYCNDRSLSSGTGIGNTKTDYGYYSRITPTLKCDLADYTNDSFTVNTNLGNGLLKYPVALITADEVVMAGARGVGGIYVINQNFYLRNENIYWTMTPFSYRHIAYVDSYDIYWEMDFDYSDALEVLPVISLKAGVLNYGNGTKETPFTTSQALMTLTNLGLTEHIKNKNLITFTPTSNEDGTTGIYKTQDDIGESYYFRGNIDYNYVKFGKYKTDVYQYSSEFVTTCPTGHVCKKIASANDDMYWRIIRINGDGTIRMIYSGTEPYANNATEANRNIGKSAYNLRNSATNSSVGYMYGTGKIYETTHENTENSTVKEFVDLWYDTYLETEYEQYISDAIYCNDRKTNEEPKTIFGIKYTGEGIDGYSSIYGFGNRLDLENKTYITPTLKCEQENDRFTKGASVSGITGNNALENPIGLITADELVFAGLYYYKNIDLETKNVTYLYDENSTITMSPLNYHEEGIAEGRSVPILRFHGDNISDGDVELANNIRPVISLKAGEITDGDGSSINPFVVEE